MNAITASVITCPGRLGDDIYRALEINIAGVSTPFHAVLALPAVTCHALRESVDVAELYAELARRINCF